MYKAATTLMTINSTNVKSRQPHRLALLLQQQQMIEARPLGFADMKLLANEVLLLLIGV